MDQSVNPYKAPEQSDSQRFPPQAFPDLSFKQLRKLHDHSRIIGVLGILWAISGLCWIGAITYVLSLGIPNANFYAALYAAMAVVMMVSSYACFSRPAWGRYLCLITCMIMLIGIPIGTLIGIIGLVAFSNAGQLFGGKRRTHKTINEEYRYRRAHCEID